MKNKMFKILVSNCIVAAMAIGMTAGSAQGAPTKVTSFDHRGDGSVSTVPIPEPTSLAVVLLAGVMVLRRRRRSSIDAHLVH